MHELYDVEHSYKEFIYRLRKCEIDEPSVIVGSYSSTRLKNYFHRIEAVKLLEDANSVQAYYGKLKIILLSFMGYHSDVMDTAYEVYHSFSNNFSQNDWMKYVENTLEIQAISQNEFLDEFLPIKSPREQSLYDEIIKKYDEYLEKFLTISNKILTFSNQKYLNEFVKEHFEKVVFRHTEECLLCVRLFLSVMLLDRVSNIRLSLQEILCRMSDNKRDYLKKYQDDVKHRIDELYDLNKQKIYLIRKHHAVSEDLAVVNKTVETIINKINISCDSCHLNHLEKETEYWARRLEELDVIINIIKECKEELAPIVADEERLAYLRSTGKEVHKTVCCSVLHADFEERKVSVKAQLIEAGQCLFTFFAITGTNSIKYRDNIGCYNVDKFNHRIYSLECGSKRMDVDCEGNFIETHAVPYYFDEVGRYIMRDGKKIYKLAPCTSEYELGPDDLLKKITKDCGHSENWRPDCRKGFTDPANIEILPTTKQTNIEKTLNEETVAYLWNTFGWILPEALNTLWSQKPLNPMHILAHTLLRLKQRHTPAEAKAKQKVATEYREIIYKKEREKIMQAMKLRKSKLVKRRKPEESDDTKDIAAMTYLTAGLQYSCDLSEHYNN